MLGVIYAMGRGKKVPEYQYPQHSDVDAWTAVLKPKRPPDQRAAYFRNQCLVEDCVPGYELTQLL